MLGRPTKETRREILLLRHVSPSSLLEAKDLCLTSLVLQVLLITGNVEAQQILQVVASLAYWRQPTYHLRIISPSRECGKHSLRKCGGGQQPL